MGKTKKIQINAEYLTAQQSNKKKRKEKPKGGCFISPNKVRRALMDRVKKHQLEKMSGGEKEAAPLPKANFRETLSYLNSVVNRKNTLKAERKQKSKAERKQRRRVRARRRKGGESGIRTKITTRDDPPYGILKGGKKPLYSEYKKTLRNKNKSTSIVLPQEEKVTGDIPMNRKKKLEILRKKMKTPPTRKRRLKRYTLGKRKGKVGVLIKSRKTRRKIKKEHYNLKKKKLSEIKLYLKKHGLIKVGSNAPENVMRQIYETAVLSGDVYNKSGEVLYHNFMNDKKP